MESKPRYAVHKNESLAYIWTQINPAHVHTSPSSQVSFSILPLHARYILPSCLATTVLNAFRLFPVHVTCPAHYILFDFKSQTIYDK
jgi:hypothetical protein